MSSNAVIRLDVFYFCFVLFFNDDKRKNTTGETNETIFFSFISPVA